MHLTPIEWQILATLLASAGRTLTHQQIFDAVWGRQFGSPQQYLRVHITNLRRKIEIDPAAPQIIITEPGVGYRAELAALTAWCAVDATCTSDAGSGVDRARWSSAPS